MIAALELAHPGWLLLLVVPLLVLWFTRRLAARPRPDATGALEIWKRSGPEAPRATRRGSIPPAAWLLCAGLVCAVIALAGPRSGSGPAARRLLVVVDRSPSMYLASDGRTRMERALDRARGLVQRLGYDDVRWIAPPLARDEDRAPRDFPTTWLAPPPRASDEPDFAAYDRTDTLWVTDAGGALVPHRAGVCASGGEAVPGPIAVEGERQIDWDGRELVPGAPVERGRVVLDARLPGRVLGIARAWARARALDSAADGADSAADARLVVRSVLAGTPRECLLARDGWRAGATCAGPLPASDATAVLDPWLAAPDGEVVVARASGLVEVALVSIEEEHGDPAAWAVSWSALFDSATAPPPGCVDLAERTAAGAPLTRDPVRGPGPLVEEGPGPAIAAALGAVLALLALLLVAAPNGRSMGSGTAA